MIRSGSIGKHDDMSSCLCRIRQNVEKAELRAGSETTHSAGYVGASMHFEEAHNEAVKADLPATAELLSIYDDLYMLKSFAAHITYEVANRDNLILALNDIGEKLESMKEKIDYLHSMSLDGLATLPLEFSVYNGCDDEKPHSEMLPNICTALESSMLLLDGMTVSLRGLERTMIARLFEMAKALTGIELSLARMEALLSPPETTVSELESTELAKLFADIEVHAAQIDIDLAGLRSDVEIGDWSRNIYAQLLAARKGAFRLGKRGGSGSVWC